MDLEEVCLLAIKISTPFSTNNLIVSKTKLFEDAPSQE